MKMKVNKLRLCVYLCDAVDERTAVERERDGEGEDTFFASAP